MSELVKTTTESSEQALLSRKFFLFGFLNDLGISMARNTQEDETLRQESIDTKIGTRSEYVDMELTFLKTDAFNQICSALKGNFPSKVDSILASAPQLEDISTTYCLL